MVCLLESARSESQAREVRQKLGDRSSCAWESRAGRREGPGEPSQVIAGSLEGGRARGRSSEGSSADGGFAQRLPRSRCSFCLEEDGDRWERASTSPSCSNTSVQALASTTTSPLLTASSLE